MTVYEALKILEISGSYTEKKLKRVYHELAKKYHPDNFKDNNERRQAEEKLKNINLAYETLLNNKDRGSYQESRNSVFNYKKEKQQTLEKYRPQKYKHFFRGYCFMIDAFIKNFVMKDYNTISEVNNSYHKVLEEIIDVYKTLETEFYKDNNINKSKIIETINYNCSFDEFYEQLLKIKEKYSVNLESIFSKYAKKITEKYKNYSGYNIAKVEINTIIERRFAKAKGKINNVRNTEEISQQLANAFFTADKEIMNAIAQAIKLQNKLDSLFLEITEANDVELSLEYMSIKSMLQKGTSIPSAKERINHLEKMIKIKKKSSGLLKFILNKFKENIIIDKINVSQTTEYYKNILAYASNLHNLSTIDNILYLLNNKLYDLIFEQITININNDNSKNRESQRKKHHNKF